MEAYSGKSLEKLGESYITPQSRDVIELMYGVKRYYEKRKRWNGMDRGYGRISQRRQGGNEDDWGFVSRISAQIIYSMSQFPTDGFQPYWYDGFLFFLFRIMIRSFGDVTIDTCQKTEEEGEEMGA